MYFIHPPRQEALWQDLHKVFNMVLDTSETHFFDGHSKLNALKKCSLSSRYYTMCYRAWGYTQ